MYRRTGFVKCAHPCNCLPDHDVGHFHFTEGSSCPFSVGSSHLRRLRLPILALHRNWTGEYMYVFVLLFSFNVFESHPCCDRYWYPPYQRFVHFYCWVVFCWMTISQFVRPFSCWWALGVFPGFGYCEWVSCKHSRTRLFWEICFHFSWVIT